MGRADVDGVMGNGWKLDGRGEGGRFEGGEEEEGRRLRRKGEGEQGGENRGLLLLLLWPLLVCCV